MMYFSNPIPSMVELFPLPPQSTYDKFRLLKYDISSARLHIKKAEDPVKDRPLLVGRHNASPGMFLVREWWHWCSWDRKTILLQPVYWSETPFRGRYRIWRGEGEAAMQEILCSSKLALIFQPGREGSAHASFFLRGGQPFLFYNSMQACDSITRWLVLNRKLCGSHYRYAKLKEITHDWAVSFPPSRCTSVAN